MWTKIALSYLIRRCVSWSTKFTLFLPSWAPLSLSMWSGDVQAPCGWAVDALPCPSTVWATQKGWWSLSIRCSPPVLCAVLGSTAEEGCEGPWTFPEERTRLLTALEGMSCELWLRAPGLSGLEERRLRGDLLRRENSDDLISYPWDPMIQHVGMVQSCARGVQAGHQKAFLYQGCVQTLKQPSKRHGWCPKLVGGFG